MKTVTTLILLLFLGVHVVAQTKGSFFGCKSVVNYCNLVDTPDKFNQREIILSATYRYGFEQSELYCLGCEDSGSTWVEFDESFKKSTKSKYRKMVRKNGFRGRTVNVEAIGIFYSGGGYGDGSYSNKFVIKSLRKAEIVADSGLLPKVLSVEQRARVCNN